MLAALRDDEMAALVRAAPAMGAGVGGGCSRADVDGAPVFVKRVPITDRELADPHSTANVFDLPVAWQYGMYRLAGPGFGAWRELAANQSVTEGILAGETESFALLHHWRVLPGRPPVAAEHLRHLTPLSTSSVGNPPVPGPVRRSDERDREPRAVSRASPRRAASLAGRPDRQSRRGRAATVRVVAFLRHREILHLDGHFGNIRADDDRLYLVDFGLATSPRFDLSDAERDFAARNADHDADYASMRLVNWLVTSVCGVPVPTDGDSVARNRFVQRCATGDIPPDVPAHVAEIIARHAPAAARMNEFCCRLFDGDLHAAYPGKPGPPRPDLPG